MPNAGDSFRVKLKPVHLNWGTVSSDGGLYTNSYFRRKKA